MLVGSTLSGKSTVWQLLARTLKRLKVEKGEDKFRSVSYEILNPKAVSMNELFGFVDDNTMEWNDGVLSALMGKICKMESNDERWMVIDGPVDTFWIESMNTVLDDNKMLTLLNGDRISLPKEVSVLMEVDDLS
jgi:dynein heavy chain